MIRIGRDHGKLRHEVGEISMSELAIYEANYRYEDEERKKAEERAKQKAAVKK